MKIVQKKENKSFEKNEKMSESIDGHLVKTEILGVGITNDTNENVLEFLENFLQKSSKKCYIVTPNPEILVLAAKDIEFKKVLNNAEIALNDGVGVSLAGWVLGRSLKERFTGVNFVESVCEKCNDWPITVGFLGAGPKVAEKTAECLRAKFPGLKVVFADDHWPGERSMINGDELGIMNKELGEKDNSKDSIIHHSSFLIPKIDVLFVAYGAPKQEFWMAENLSKLPIRVMVGVGGAFDYISGNVRRAPKWIQNIGMEWLFRLILQPWRLKRQLALLEFIGIVFKERLSSKNSTSIL